MRDFRLVLFTLGVTYLLLLLGGLVHATGSSLACPDWPLCYGQVFPEMVGGVLGEHSHRLVDPGGSFGDPDSGVPPEKEGGSRP